MAYTLEFPPVIEVKTRRVFAVDSSHPPGPENRVLRTGGARQQRQLLTKPEVSPPTPHRSAPDGSRPGTPAHARAGKRSLSNVHTRRLSWHRQAGKVVAQCALCSACW